MMARTADASTEAFPLDCKTCTLATAPFRKISKLTTARGAHRSEGSTVLCSQLLLTRFCTAVTYQEKRPANSPPPCPLKPMPALVAPPAPMPNCVYGTAGEPPCP